MPLKKHLREMAVDSQAMGFFRDFEIEAIIKAEQSIPENPYNFPANNRIIFFPCIGHFSSTRIP
ncbi:MAG TPA: hypothetical protein PLM29_12430 [Deltaproteobacteria bacterium]|nr:hypothetical protein [Deltaproteobacteria bacterium]